MGFSREKYWNGLSCPSPGHLPNPRTEPYSLKSPALACEFFTTSTTWEALRRDEVAKVLGTIFQVPDFKVRATLSTLKKKKNCLYLAVLGLSWGMQNLVPQPGIELKGPALGMQSLSHWTTREVPMSEQCYLLRLWSPDALLAYVGSHHIEAHILFWFIKYWWCLNLNN